MVTSNPIKESEIYQGRFGEFTIERGDRLEVIIYRAGLSIAALCVILATIGLLAWGENPLVLQTLTPLFLIFSLSIGISLITIHIYLGPLKRLLQLFWFIGTISTLVLLSFISQPLAVYVYNHPLTILGVGFTFAALTGIYVKEGFCFQRLEAKLITPLLPVLLLGHISGFLGVGTEKIILLSWTILFCIFVARKLTQAIPPDIGDKSVFAYLKQQKQAKVE